MEINYSVGRVLLLTYVILASSQCQDLFSSEMTNFIKNNKVVQHLILLIMIFVLMSLFGNPLKQSSGDDTISLIIISCLVYVWFIFTTKLSVTWNFGIIILLCIYFFYDNYKLNQYDKKIEDSKLKEKDKEDFIKSFIKDHQMLLLGLFGLTLIGTIIYSVEQSEISIQTGGGKKDFIYFLMN